MYPIAMFFLTVFALVLGFATPYPQKKPIPLTVAQQHRLASWSENDTQNIWELSGQFEGDIILPRKKTRNGVIDLLLRWPNKVLPYEIGSEFSADEKKYIEQAIQIFNERTCVRVRPRNAMDKDYVHVSGLDRGCYSLVGRNGGRQELNLQRKGCLRVGTIQHEFLHALGFHHQQSSSDRDDYVTIKWENIRKGMEGNFKKYRIHEITDFGVSYDYGSVMHYSPYAFSVNGERTILLNKDYNAQIGQRKGPSAKDITKLKRMYNC